MQLVLPEDLEFFVIDVPGSQQPESLFPDAETPGIELRRRQTIMIYKVGNDIFDLLVLRYFSTGPSSVTIDFFTGASITTNVSISVLLQYFQYFNS